MIRNVELSELSLGSGGRSHSLRFLSSIIAGHQHCFLSSPFQRLTKPLLLISDSLDLEVRRAGQTLHNHELASSIDPSSDVA